ncbi:hypothetical protein BGX27_006250 [Mortierella sp. AM989]|nr:hypothetical protein BGX27_006250 [Mortierella sp. AM989]
MLAHNKIQANTRQEFIHITQPQSQNMQCDRRETFWALSSGDEEVTQQVENRKDHMSYYDQHCYQYEDNHQLQLEQRQQKHRIYRQQEQSQLFSDQQKHRYHVGQQPRLVRSMGSIRSTTIHPTIANMVSATSPRLQRTSSSPSPSFRRSFSSSSPRSRNVSMSPKRESETLDRHYLLRHSLSSSPSPQKGDIGENMDMDQEYAFEELDSDSMMDQCEPQRGWSSSSSQQTNSPSPVMSCTQYQLPSLKRHPSLSSSTSHHSHRSQQEPPPPQQQPLRDQNPQPRLSFAVHNHDALHRQVDLHSYIHLGSSHPRHYRDQQASSQRQHEPTEVTVSSSDSPALAESNFRKSSSSIYQPRKSKARPHSYPSGGDGQVQYYSSRPVSPSMFAQSSDLKRQGEERLSSSVRPRTPPFLNLPPPQQLEGSQYQHESRKRERDTERESERHKRAIILPLPKGYEYMSEAQKTLYERHPPSPQCDRSPSSSSAPSSPSRGCQSPSIPTSPIQPILCASFERSHRDITCHLPPPPANIDPLEHRYGHQSHQSDRQQHDERQSHHAQQTSQGSVPLLPKLSTLSLPRRQSFSEAENLSGSSARSSMSLSSPARLPSPSMTTPIAVSNAQGTEGMTIIKSEEGAIVVYNPTTDTMTFRCELCPSESFGRIHDLKRHQTSKHQEMTWPCDFCHRPFVRRDALLRHYTVKAARGDGLHPASHEVDKLLAARARAKMLY